MKRYSLAFLGVAFCLAGCGGSTSSTSGNSGITGNWELTLTNGGVPSYGTASYGIYLTQTGSAVSGIMLGQQGYPDCWAPPAPPCAFPFGTLDPVLAGTIDAAGNIALASDPAYPGASLSITASTTGTALGGTYSTTLVTTSPPGTWSNQGTISGIEIGVLNGTYGGTLKSSVTGLSMGITTTLRQNVQPRSRRLSGNQRIGKFHRLAVFHLSHNTDLEPRAPFWKFPRRRPDSNQQPHRHGRFIGHALNRHKDHCCDLPRERRHLR